MCVFCAASAVFLTARWLASVSYKLTASLVNDAGVSRTCKQLVSTALTVKTEGNTAADRVYYVKQQLV